MIHPDTCRAGPLIVMGEVLRDVAHHAYRVNGGMAETGSAAARCRRRSSARSAAPRWPEDSAGGGSWPVRVTGAAAVAAVDRVARARQAPNEIPALWSRIVASAAIAAALGWLVGLIRGSGR